MKKTAVSITNIHSLVYFKKSTHEKEGVEFGR